VVYVRTATANAQVVEHGPVPSLERSETAGDFFLAFSASAPRPTFRLAVEHAGDHPRQRARSLTELAGLLAGTGARTTRRLVSLKRHGPHEPVDRFATHDRHFDGSM
jgi:hypothetical protein